MPGWDLESSRAAVALGSELGVDAAAGIHPHVADRADDSVWAAIVELAADRPVVAVGETGLDYDRGFSPRARPAGQPAPPLRPLRGDRQARDHPLPIKARRA